MGFFGSLGRALTAPIRATNKVVGKAPGMQGAMGMMNKLPGMQTANKFNPMMMGMQQPQQPQGIGPSPSVVPQPPPDMSQMPMQPQQEQYDMQPQDMGQMGQIGMGLGQPMNQMPMKRRGY